METIAAGSSKGQSTKKASPSLSEKSIIGRNNGGYEDDLSSTSGSIAGSMNASTVHFADDVGKSTDNVRPKGEREHRKRKPVGSLTRLKRGIRGLWKTTASEGVDKEEDRDLFVRMSLRELGIYLLFLVNLCVLAFCMLDPSMFQFTKVMLRLFVHNPGLPDINTDVGFWKYVEEDLINGMFWEKYYNGKDVHYSEEGYIYFENRLMGRARLRQLRVRDKTCPIGEIWGDIIDHCFGGYSFEHEDKSSFGITNHSEYNNTAWNYQSAEELEYGSFVGRLAKYSGGGFTRLLVDKAAESKERVTDLKKKQWIDRGTRAVFVEFSVYNANLNLFCLINILFEFPATGAVTTIYRFSTLKLLRYVTTMDFFVMACEGFLLLFLLYYTIEEIIEINLHGINYFKGMWNCFDIIVLVLGYGCLALNMYRTLEVSKILKSILQNRDYFSNFSLIGFWQEKFNDAMAVTIFFCWMKVFKYISFNQTMAELESTLITCAKDVAGFCVMFFIIFFAYAQWGYQLFGSQLRDYSTVGNCMLTLFRVILGDFDFLGMQNAKPFWGPFYFISYIFMVFFVLLNMFLAIVNDTYCEVKEELDEEFEPFDVGAYFTSGYKKMVSNLSSQKNNIVNLKELLKNADTDNNNEIDFEEWRTYLKDRGHADFEIEALFAKYDKDGDRVLNSDEVDQMLDELDEEEDEVDRELSEVNKAKSDADRIFSKLMLRDENDQGESSSEEEEDDDDDDEKFVSASEFKSLLKRVDNTEGNVYKIVTKVEGILVKLEAMDTVKIKRRETMSRLIDSIGEYMDHPVKWRSQASMRSRVPTAMSRAGGRHSVMSKASLVSVKVES